MKKIFVLFFCLLGSAALWAQENTVLGTGALSQATASKYAIQYIQVIHNNGYRYSLPSLDFGGATINWDYNDYGVSDQEFYFNGYFTSTSQITQPPTILGGHGTGSIVSFYEIYYDGTYYYYDVSVSGGTGYGPTVSLSSSTGSSFYIYTYISTDGALFVGYGDDDKTNVYTTAPTINISFGDVTATAVLDGTPANGQNTAIGHQALYSNNGRENTALGYQSLNNATGNSNLGIGYLAGNNLTTGNNNLFIGRNAGKGITTGSGNVFIGNGSNLNPSSSLSNSMIFTDGSGNPRMFVGNSGAVKIGYGYDFTETSSARLMVNGSINATSSLNATHAYLSGQLSFKNSASTFYHDFMFFNPNPNTFDMRAVVDANNYPSVFTVDKPSASMTFYAPVKGVGAVNSNEFVTLGQLASGQTIGANISGSANLSNLLLNTNISGQDLTNSSIVSASNFRAMNGSGIIGAPDNGWWNILSMRHSNAANDYRMEIAGSYSDPQKIVFRNTADSPARGWSTFFHSGNTDYVRTSLGLPANPLRSHRAVEWIIAPGADANTIEENTSSFTYSNNAPTVGPLAHFGNSGYGLQLNAAYSGASSLYFRTRNGDGNWGWNNWKRLLFEDSSSNWDINISGSSSKWNNNTFNAGEVASPAYFVTGNGGSSWGYSSGNQLKTALGLPTSGGFDLHGSTGRGNVTTNNIIAQSFGIRYSDGSTYQTIGVDHTGLGTLYRSFITGGDVPVHRFRGSEAVDLLVIKNGGNVGIGIENPLEKLAVNGKIRAREVKVEPINGWPDYVFEETYKPKTLKEIEAFIKVNKHLPEVPSAREVGQNGVELGEMNRILLKKIEELTLHLIAKEKELQATNDRIDQLSEIVKQLITTKTDKK